MHMSHSTFTALDTRPCSHLDEFRNPFCNMKRGQAVFYVRDLRVVRCHNDDFGPFASR
jgi:hypothetical protein